MSVLKVNELNGPEETDGAITMPSDAHLNINGTIATTGNGQIAVPKGTTDERPDPATAGMIRFNTNAVAMEVYDGTDWVVYGGGGSGGGGAQGASADSPITDWTSWSATSPVSGLYWVLPTGYSGAAEEVYIDVDGTESGINAGGVWVRVRYAQSYFSRSSTWNGTGRSGPSSESSTAYSGDFAYEQNTDWVRGLMDAGFEEVRQTFESWGYGSVGWTYGSGYMESRGLDNVNYTRWNTSSNIVGKDYTRVSGMSHSTSSINGPFDNPTSRNTDASDQNDSVWRYGRFYFRFTGDGNTRPLPILGIWNADVDQTNEQRYFPFRDSAGGWTGQGESDIWIKVLN